MYHDEVSISCQWFEISFYIMKIKRMIIILVHSNDKNVLKYELEINTKWTALSEVDCTILCILM